LKQKKNLHDWQSTLNIKKTPYEIISKDVFATFLLQKDYSNRCPIFKNATKPFRAKIPTQIRLK
jgi:hypothetical protein